MNVPRPIGGSFLGKDPVANLSTPGQLGAMSLNLNSKGPIKLPPKGIKIIQKS